MIKCLIIKTSNETAAKVDEYEMSSKIFNLETLRSLKKRIYEHCRTFTREDYPKIFINHRKIIILT